MPSGLVEASIGTSDTLVIAVDGTGAPMRTGLCNEAKVAARYLLRDRTTDGSGRDRLQRLRVVAWIGDRETGCAAWVASS